MHLTGQHLVGASDSSKSEWSATLVWTSNAIAEGRRTSFGPFVQLDRQLNCNRLNVSHFVLQLALAG